jgi:hypothetical protein
MAAHRELDQIQGALKRASIEQYQVAVLSHPGHDYEDAARRWNRFHAALAWCRTARLYLLVTSVDSQDLRLILVADTLPDSSRIAGLASRAGFRLNRLLAVSAEDALAILEPELSENARLALDAPSKFRRVRSSRGFFTHEDSGYEGVLLRMPLGLVKLAEIAASTCKLSFDIGTADGDEETLNYQLKEVVSLVRNSKSSSRKEGTDAQ